MIIRNKNMGCFNLVSIVFVYLFCFSNLLISIEHASAQPTYVYHFCLGDNYTTNSTFSKNLNLLLPSLSSANPSVTRNGYYNNTVGRNPDMVYGSLQCRGDISVEDCQGCVKVATEDINKDERCPNSKQAIIFYDECLLRYSNQNYFTTMQDKPGVYLWNTKNISNPDQFRPVRADLLIRIAGQAVSSNGSINFATGDTNFTNRIKVYGLVQCTADIPSGSCYQCLFGAISEIPNCCDGSQGGRVVRPSCNWRYEIYPFFKPQLPPSTNTTAHNANRNNSSKLVISIVVPLVIIVLSAIAFWFFCLWRKKTKTKKLE
ncbi:hypothetical protein MKW94_009134, partial [Papaver nudicaule]|nr:hypothetical protein [Papaver nudicaule]